MAGGGPRYHIAAQQGAQHNLDLRRSSYKGAAERVCYLIAVAVDN